MTGCKDIQWPQEAYELCAAKTNDYTVFVPKCHQLSILKFFKEVCNSATWLHFTNNTVNAQARAIYNSLVCFPLPFCCCFFV